MGVGSKHIATFLLGAAAGLAAFKYANMSEEEKEKLMADLKAKANDLKNEAEGAADKAKEYFEELKTKGSSAFKDQFGDLDGVFDDLFGKKTPDNSAKPSDV
jgi:chromosome segregation ATPase